MPHAGDRAAAGDEVEILFALGVPQARALPRAITIGMRMGG